jgi:hypothetical protein
MRLFLKKYNVWIDIVIFLLVVLLTVFFAILPLKRSIQANSDDIQKKIIDDSLNKSRISKIPEMEKTEEVLEESKSNLNIILANDNEVDFIRKIEALADETGNKVTLKITDETQAVKTAPAKKDAAIPEDIKSKLPYTKYLPMQIDLEGGYAEALNFIHKLENMQYYVNVISLNMSKSDPSEVSAPKSDGLFGKSAPNVSQTASEKVLKTSLEVIIYLEK